MPSRTQRPRLVPALELDLLDSPLDSPSMAFPSATPFSSSLGLTPGSALAEHIFNDPDSWGNDDADLTDDDDDDRDDDLELGGLDASLRERGPTVDPMAWFLEEVQRFRLGSAGVQSESDGSSTAFSFSPDSVGFGLEEEEDGEETEAELEGEGALDKAVLVPSPGVDEETKGVKKMRKSVRPISLAAFFEAGDGIPKDVQVQLEEVLKSGKFPPGAYNHLKALSSGSLTTPSTGDSSSAMSTAGTTSSSLSDSSSLASPVIHSASATLSFLEWYGIYPDSPRLDTSKPNNNSLRKSIYTKEAPRRPHLAIPLPKSAVHLSSSSRPPSSILSPSVLMPDLSIEAPKRGSAVPPLRDLKPMLERIVGQASKGGAPVESDKKEVELTKQAQEEEDGTEKPSTEKEEKENLRPLNPPGLAPRAASPPSVVVVEVKKPTTPPPPTSTPGANVSPPPAVIETAEPAKPEPPVTTKPTLTTPPRKIARKPKDASPVTPVTKLSTSSASRTPTPPRPRPQALAELSRRRQLLAISVKDSPPPYSRTEGGASTATIGGSRPMPTSTLRSSGSRERLHPPPPATSNPIIRRLPMVPPSAGPTTQGSSSERERSATAVPRTLNSNSAAMSGPASSRPAPSFGSLYSAQHSRSNSNSSSNSSLNPVSAQPAHQPGPTASPLPSSLPTATAMGSSLLSPEPIGGAQTIVYQARPMSAVRSPMGGVMGPRSRSSTPNNGVRTSSGLARRPPVLNL